MNKIFSFLLVSVLFASCSQYQKALKSDDVAVKSEAANKMYETGKYTKAIRLYEQIAPAYKGKPNADDLKRAKEFAENLIYKKDEYDNYIYMNCIKDNKLSSSDLWLRKQKFKINNYEILSEQMFIHYGCLIYKDGYEQDKIEKIFAYFKEVDYLVRNYSNQYYCLSEELKILKDNTSFLIDGNKKILGNNVKKFLFRGGQKSLDCLNDLLLEFETNPLVKYIYFMHNYVERGFDLAVSKTITSDLYRENQNFIDDLRLCLEELNNNNFRINLNNLKELMVFHINSELKIIDKLNLNKSAM